MSTKMLGNVNYEKNYIAGRYGAVAGVGTVQIVIKSTAQRIILVK